MTEPRRRTRGWVGGLAVAGAAIGIFAATVTAVDSDEAPRRAAAPAASPATSRPSRPPGPNDPRPAPIAAPELPRLSDEDRAKLAAQVRGSERPGEAAFRLVSDRYVDENLDMAKQKAQVEGLTLAEVRELTYFGLLVLATQRLGDVEDIVGKPLSEGQRDALADLMQSSNREFIDGMRALVRRGAGEAERWAMIRTAQDRYRAELYRITGLDDGTLDDLLAGNIALPGAPGRGDAPEGPPAGGPRDDVSTPPRPRGP